MGRRNILQPIRKSDRLCPARLCTEFANHVSCTTRERGLGAAYGAEITAQYEINESWRVSGWYAFLQLELSRAASDIEDSSPHNQVALMSSWDLTKTLELDVISRYVDNVPFVDASHYISMDVRLGWRPSEEWEFSIVGQNLLEEHRREFSDFGAARTSPQR